MKKSLLVLSVALLSFNAHAAVPSVKCDVRTLADAKECMEKQALAIPEVEESNDALTSARTDLLANLMKAFDAEVKKVRAAKNADFAGAVIVHEDEHHILYFALKKGTGVKPVMLYDLNVADLALDVDGAAELPSIETIFIGNYGKQYDVFEDVVNELKEAEEERGLRFGSWGGVKNQAIELTVDGEGAWIAFVCSRIFIRERILPDADGEFTIAGRLHHGGLVRPGDRGTQVTLNGKVTGKTLKLAITDKGETETYTLKHGQATNFRRCK